MKVVINALQYKPNNSGIGVLIRELFGAFTIVSKRQCQFILPRDSGDFPVKSGTELIRAPLKHGQGLKRILFQCLEMGLQYCKESILLITDSKTPFLLPKSCKLVPLITDLAVFRMPEVYKHSRVLLWKLQYKYVCYRADLFLAISEFTKNEIIKVLGIAPEKIRVVPLACSDRMIQINEETTLTEIRAKYGLPKNYILFVGNNNPRKNLDRTIQAFDHIKISTGVPHKLVIAGELGWKFDRAKALEGVIHSGDVIFTGFISDEDLPAIYSMADLFVFPTLYEGFGIPVIEAQRCGTPVVTSNITALPDVAGEGAELVDPYNTESISNGMMRVLLDTEYSEYLVKAGFENAKRFSWEKSARVLNEIVEEFAGGLS